MIKSTQNSSHKVSVCHISSVHTRFDRRIFDKECRGLSQHFNVYYIVADGKKDEIQNNVTILGIGSYPNNRLKRMLLVPWKVYSKARSLKSHIYHFHDPELIPVGLLLKWTGRKVIYDVHEDVPNDILLKPWIPSFLRKPISLLFDQIEQFAAKRFTGIVTSTPHIRDRFIKTNPNCIDIKNFPDKELYSANSIHEENRITKYDACYIGVISDTRGVNDLINVLDTLTIQIAVAGRFENEFIENKLKSNPNWGKVTYLGVLNKSDITILLNQSYIGIVVLDSTLTFRTSLPIKLFEYMSAGMPVIASNFEYWKQIIETERCGLSIPPNNKQALITALKYLIENKSIGDDMGKNGKKAIINRYNWESELKSFIIFYQSIL